MFLTNGAAQDMQSVYRGPEQVKHPSKQGLQSSPSTVLYILVSSHGVKQDPFLSIPGGYLIFSLAQTKQSASVPPMQLKQAGLQAAQLPAPETYSPSRQGSEQNPGSSIAGGYLTRL